MGFIASHWWLWAALTGLSFIGLNLFDTLGIHFDSRQWRTNLLIFSGIIVVVAMMSSLVLFFFSIILNVAEFSQIINLPSICIEGFYSKISNFFSVFFNANFICFLPNPLLRNSY